MSDSELEVRVAWQRHLGQSRVANTWLESVIGRYREPHRHYHDVRHLRWVVRHVERLADDHPADDLGAVIAAAFFHDVIYDPTAPDNEAASSRLAATALEQLEWEPERVTNVAAMIEGTAHHNLAEAAIGVDHCLLYAADLAVLAAEPAGYSDYVRNVRREYHHVSDVDWVSGRTSVLQGFLSRPAIYAARLALGSWEQRARGNLTSEIDGLRRQATPAG